MDQRVDFITLGVPDLAAARRFYVEGLGWTPALEVEGEVIFLQVAHGVLLSLWDAKAMAADIGAGAPAGAPGAGVTLSHNVATRDEVPTVLERAVAAGATLLKPAQDTEWGGRTGYFADPAGVVWEVAHNPNWRVEADGRVVIGS